MNKRLIFDPNSDEHLIWALKLAFKYASGDMSVGQEETTDALCDALCNLVGDDEFCKFMKEDLTNV